GPWVLALARSGRLPAQVVGTLAAALADRGDPDEQLLRELIDCGRAAGVELGGERLEQLEGRRVGAEVARIAAGAPLDGTPAPVTSARVQELAARRCEAPLAVAGPVTAITLLAWAAGAGVPVDEAAVAAGGGRLIGPS